MLFRKMMNELTSWKENEKCALLIEGARQVGKTKLIEEFIKDFNNSIEIDFTKNTNALSLLLETKSYDDFINRLSLISPISLKDSNDILFLDEIKYYYEMREKRIVDDPLFAEKHIDIITLTKEIVNRGDFRIILSGSMLGVSVFNINLNPTGYLRKVTMYPMDFEEFLLAKGIKQELIGDLRQSFINKEAIDDTLNETLLKCYSEYLFVGGFPAAVQGYIDDESFNATSNALESIDNWYRGDILKYAPKEDRLVISEMYDILPSEISMKNKKFVKSHLVDIPDYRNLDLKDRFLWLKKAGIALPIYNVTNPKYPLKISEDYKVVKLFINDVGLLTHFIFDNEAKRKLLVDKGDVDLGAIYENAAAELLTAHGYNPFFHSTKKRGEIDFILEKNMTVIPIEIKSYAPDKKTGYFSHQALNLLLESHKEIKESWIFGLNNIKKEGDNIYMFPAYMIEFVRKN